jgi:hypothetical protein
VHSVLDVDIRIFFDSVVYEAVEVMAAERGPDSAPLVGVFFAERDGPKRRAQLAATRFHEHGGATPRIGGPCQRLGLPIVILAVWSRIVCNATLPREGRYFPNL